jgi:tetratricopeptide (TPR) repeat protein
LSTERGPKGREFYRTTARLIADAADALEHAHSVGIVHRDVKPGNLIVDANGKVWVADFGLARVGPDAGLTMSGDLLGTLRYMAPEQALSHHGLVDHRADVYALGATLYELLTGKPAVDASERAEVLRKIAFEDPAPPRKLDKAIPAELETVALKCLAKNPAERYATAGELAADLRRWLADQPIKAKPPSLRERAAKWARRHVAAVWAAAAALAATVAALAAVTLVVWHQGREVRSAYAAEQAQRRRAEDNLHVARDAADRMLPKLVEVLDDVPRMEKDRRGLLEQALRIYQGFLQQYGDDRAVRLEAAAAARKAGDIYFEIGQHKSAERTYRQAVALLQEMADAEPPDPAVLRELGRSFCGLAKIGIDTGAAGAEKAAREAIRLHERLTAGDSAEPGDWLDLVGDINELALTLRGPDEREALRRGIDLIGGLPPAVRSQPRARHLLATLHHNMGVSLALIGRKQEAEDPLRRATQLREALVTEFPYSRKYRNRLADCLNSLSDTRLDREDEAALRRKAVDLHLSLLADFPDIGVHQESFHPCKSNLLDLLWKQGRFEEGAAVQRRAVEVWQRLHDNDPGDIFYLHMLVSETDELGIWLERSGSLQEAADMYGRAVRFGRELAAKARGKNDERFRENYDAHLILALDTSYQKLGRVLRKLGRLPEAEDADRQAATLLEKGVGEHADSIQYRLQLAARLKKLAEVLREQGRPADARPVLEQLRSHVAAAVNLVPARAQVPKDAAGQCRQWLDFANSLEELSPEVDDEFRRAVREAAESADRRGLRHGAAWFLATCREERFRDPQRAVELARTVVEAFPQDDECWTTLGVAHYRAGQTFEAIAALEHSLRLLNRNSQVVRTYRSSWFVSNWLFLAMAYRQLGDPYRPLLYYATAVWRIERNRSALHEEVYRFRAEAAVLLGMPHPPKPAARPLWGP